MGVRDLAYLLGSCLSEQELQQHADNLLNYYFLELFESLRARFAAQEFTQELETEISREWRRLWPVCFADFERFLGGWSPGYGRRTGYTKRMTDQVLKDIEDGKL